jgi:hypothetical protein
MLNKVNKIKRSFEKKNIAFFDEFARITIDFRAEKLNKIIRQGCRKNFAIQ